MFHLRRVPVAAASEVLALLCALTGRRVEVGAQLGQVRGGRLPRVDLFLVADQLPLFHIVEAPEIDKLYRYI